MKRMLLILTALITLTACEENYTPRPKAYFRIDLPIKDYQRLEINCPYSFNIPQYAYLAKDSSVSSEPCWVNVNFIPYNATVHLTYKPIGEDFNLDDLQKDSRTLVYKHTIKAQEIFENPITRPEDEVYGMLYRLTGNAATSIQFYVTDSTSHYLRGVLYFNQNTNADSIAPVLDYLSEDVLQIVESLKWSK